MTDSTTPANPTETSDAPPFEWPPDGPALDDDGRLVGSVLCRRCSYDLRGQAAAGACPECGSAVGWSVLGDQFRFCDPNWVESLARGSTWLAFGVLCTAVSGFAGESLGAVVAALAGVAILIGGWMMTTQEPTRTPGRLELAIRICLALGLVSNIAAFFATVSSGSLAWEIGLGATIIGGKLAELAGVAMIFVLLRRYAFRVPNPSLARETRRVMIGFLLGLGLLGATTVSALLTASAAVSGGTTATIVAPALAAAVFGCAGVIVFLVFGIWFIVLLFNYRGLLQRSAQQARETWAKYGEHSPAAARTEGVE